MKTEGEEETDEGTIEAGPVLGNPGTCDDCDREANHRARTEEGDWVCELCVLDYDASDDVGEESMGEADFGERHEEYAAKLDHEVSLNGSVKLSDFVRREYEPFDSPFRARREIERYLNSEECDYGLVFEEGVVARHPDHVGSEYGMKEQELDRLEQDVVAFVEDNPGCEFSEIRAGVDGTFSSDSAARKLIRKVFERTDGIGRVRPGQSYEYYPAGHDVLETGEAQLNRSDTSSVDTDDDGEDERPDLDVTLGKMLSYVEEYPGVSLSRLVDAVDHHYSSKMSALGSLGNVLRTHDKAEGFRVVKEGNKRRVFPNDGESYDRFDRVKNDFRSYVVAVGPIQVGEAVIDVDLHDDLDCDVEGAKRRVLQEVEKGELDLDVRQQGDRFWAMKPGYFDDVEIEADEGEDDDELETVSGRPAKEWVAIVDDGDGDVEARMQHLNVSASGSTVVDAMVNLTIELKTMSDEAQGATEGQEEYEKEESS